MLGFFKFALATIAIPSFCFAACEIKTSNGAVAKNLDDVLFANLTKQMACPIDVFGLEKLLTLDGLTTVPSMVANQGRHNAGAGSFSFFEVSSGLSESLGRQVSQNHFYFGHFTGSDGTTVDLDQAPERGKLLIELIAWDFTEEVYNFYELIGETSSATWFYRGNSKDAFADNRALHIQKNPAKPVFGKTMRCSACHTSGGPIMKELEFPYNDWWVKTRALPFAPAKPSTDVKARLAKVIDAKEFSTLVKSGQDLLESSAPFRKFKATLSLPEQLRPLFCTTEINIVSSEEPVDAPDAELHVPAEFWLGASFASGEAAVAIPRVTYNEAMVSMKYRFGGTTRTDADHGWLAPVKGRSDFLQIRWLVDTKVIDEEFVADVLNVSFKNPLFSEARCGLLRLIPQTPTPDWRKKFEEALETSNLPASALLLENLTDPARDKAAHVKAAGEYLQEIRKEMADKTPLLKQMASLQKQRDAVSANEISKNPRGQILEPGFRVIFPVVRP